MERFICEVDIRGVLKKKNEVANPLSFDQESFIEEVSFMYRLVRKRKINCPSAGSFT